ncbi:hypothetical protein GC163_22760 [bacterium]|nr:hypothetical protein [bacterium]
MTCARWTACVASLLIFAIGCEETKEYTPPPLPPIQPSQPEPEQVPTQPAEAPTPEMPAPDPTPPTPPPRKYEPPKISWHKREWTPVGNGSQRGIGFTVIYRLVNNPDNLKMRVTLRNNQGRTIEVPTQRVENYEGVEYLSRGTTEVEAPFSALVEYQDPEADLWLPVFDYVPLERR